MIGLIANGRSWRNARAGGLAPGALALHEAPDHPDGYGEALARFAASGVTTLVVDGGDGTLRDVLSALPGAYAGAPLPAIALAPSGKTNVAAADVGGIRRGADAIARLRAALVSGAVKRSVRHPIEIAFGDRRLLGFVFGLGAFERATRLVDERVHHKGFAGQIGVALGVVASGSAALFGEEKAAWRRGVPLGLGFDGAAPEDSVFRHSFALLATSLDRWVLGLWPFWGKGEGAIAVTEIAAPPRRLFAGLATAGLGRPRPWAEAEGWRSVRADDLTLDMETGFIVDGDRFEPGPLKRVSLSKGPAITFIAP